MAIGVVFSGTNVVFVGVSVTTDVAMMMEGTVDVSREGKGLKVFLFPLLFALQLQLVVAILCMHLNCLIGRQALHKIQLI